jgi:hypothetical protein
MGPGLRLADVVKIMKKNWISPEADCHCWGLCMGHPAVSERLATPTSAKREKYLAHLVDQPNQA